jgi:hypothetical protein
MYWFCSKNFPRSLLPLCFLAIGAMNTSESSASYWDGGEDLVMMERTC